MWVGGWVGDGSRPYNLAAAAVEGGAGGFAVDGLAAHARSTMPL